MTKYLRIIGIIISILSIILIIINFLYPDKIDSITLILFGICFIPWIIPFVKSIELPGVTVEINELKGAISNNAMKMEVAIAGIGNPAYQFLSDDKISELAKIYNDIRKKLVRSDYRTNEMTKVMNLMLNLSGSIKNIEIENYINSDDDGLNLFGYAYTYLNPEEKYLSLIINSIYKSDAKPFNQYWGLSSIQKILSKHGINKIASNDINSLKKLSKEFLPGTDRSYVINQILKYFD